MRCLSSLGPVCSRLQPDLDEGQSELEQAISPIQLLSFCFGGKLTGSGGLRLRFYNSSMKARQG
jgi:hypothetical protein